jgi:hypothetical protein
LRRIWFRVASLALCLALMSGYANSEVLDKVFLNSTVLISYPVTAPPTQSADSSKANEPPQILGVKSGTGFLLLDGVGIAKGKVYLITNRHILPPEGAPKEIQIRVVVTQNDGVTKIDEISVPIVGSNGKYLPSVRVHSDATTDVAAVNIGTAAFSSKFQLLIKALTTGKYLNTSMLLPTRQMNSESIGVGTQVYILGYPAAIFDPRNVSPVLRVGVISTDPQDGYNFNEELRRNVGFPEHINGFLLDANIYPGSSGSLVVLAPEKCGCGTKAPGRAYILGIVSGSIPIFDASLHSYSRIGLGMVYSADTIKEVLDSFSISR